MAKRTLVICVGALCVVAGVLPRPGEAAPNHVMWDTSVKSGDIFGRKSWKSWDGVNKTNDFYRLDISSGDYTVALSNMTFLGAIHPYVWNSRTSSLTLNGAGVVFRQEGSTDGSLVNDTGFVPFAVRQNYSLNPVSLDGVPTTDSSILWSNALTKIVGVKDSGVGSTFRWELTRGYFSFAGVDADQSGYTLKVAKDKATTDYMQEYVFDGVETVVGGFEHYGYPTNSLVAIKGGSFKHLGDMSLFNSLNNTVQQYVGTNEFLVTGGAVVAGGGNLAVGLSKDYDDRAWRRSVVTFSGSGTRYATTGSAVFNGVADVFITNGAVVVADAGFKFGQTAKSRASLFLSGSGTLLDASASTGVSYFEGDGASSVVAGGATLKLSKTAYLGVNSADSVSLTMRGASSRMVVASAATPSFYVGVDGNATFNMEGGCLAPESESTDWQFRMASAKNCVATLNMTGGRIVSGGTTSPFYVGMGGDATANVSGGEIVSGKGFYFGYHTQDDTPKSSVLNISGDARVRATVVNVCYDTAKASTTRSGALNLLGGTLETTAVYADVSAAAGGAGSAAFRADGGTIRVTAASTTAAAALVRNMDSATCGPGGLTVDTDGYATYIAQDFADVEEGSGLFVKTGLGTLTYSGAYSVATTRVERGELLLADAAATFDTALVLTNGATFSMAGSCRTVSLAALDCANGVIVADVDDAITVNGPSRIGRLIVSLSSTPSVGDEVSLFSFAQEPEGVTAADLARAVCANVLPDGVHAAFSCAYDDVSGRYVLKIAVKADAEPIGDDDTVTWTGTGAWGTAANWSPSAPDATKKAKFAENGAGKAVAVSADAEVAAVAFDGSGFSVSGDGTLAILGEPGAAEIAVAAQTTNAILAPMEFVSAVNVGAAPGSELTLGGPISGGLIRKKGLGRLVLSAANDFVQSLSVSGGVTAVRHSGALGSVETGDGGVTLKGGTLAFEADGGDASALVCRNVLAVDRGGETTAQLLDVKRDATVDAINVDAANHDVGIVKRGAGTLTLAVTNRPRESFNLTTHRMTGLEGAPPSSNLVTFPEDGGAPSVNLGGFSVVEGGVVIRGDANSGTVYANGSGLVGFPYADATVSPSLTIDGVSFEQGSHYSKQATHFFIGYGAGKKDAPDGLTPTLRVVNGAYFKANTLHVCHTPSNQSTCYPTLVVNDSTVLSTYALNLSWASYLTVCSRIAATNSAVGVYNTVVSVRGGIELSFDNSYLGRLTTAGAKTATVKDNYLNFTTDARGSMTFANGSVLSLARMAFTSLTKDVTMTFDDSEWIWGVNRGNFVFTNDNSHLIFTMRGKGIRLAPTAGTTFETRVPFTGEGGMRNLGAGTVKFASGTYRFKGACEVAEDATVDLSAAGAVSDAAFSGTGTVLGGTFAGKTRIVLSDAADDWSGASVPTFDSCVFGGRVVVDFGRTSEDPLDDPGMSSESIVVAKFRNGTPDVSGWRLKSSSTGLRAVGGTFSVDAERGEVRMVPGHVGAILIVQ